MLHPDSSSLCLHHLNQCMKPSGFNYSPLPEPHRARTRQIIKEHPDVKNLIGKNPFTFLVILFLVGGMVVISWLLRDASWWWIIGVAYLVGAFFNHALFVMIHECAHNLLFKRKNWNMLAGIVSNMPIIFPSSVMFARYHIKHHSFQGVHQLDADLPAPYEAKLIDNSFLGKSLWLLMYPVFQAIRTFRLKEIKPFDGWVALNWSVQILFSAAIIYFFGIKAFMFMFLSFMFSIGLHPLGARWIQEHFLTLDPNQETYSYYGPLNTVAFNVGYHNEHHDFPSIPWNKLPDLKKRAPKYYDSLKAHYSWFGLFIRFLTDKNISLYSRTIRDERGKVKFNDESKPDEELLKQAAV